MTGILGVEPLDALLGKVPEGARILVSCAPDVDGRALLLQSTRNALRDGHDVIYVVTDRPPSAIRRTLNRLGQSDLERLHVVDAYSGQLGSPSDHAIQNPSDIAALSSTFLSLSKKHAGALLCIESISSLIDRTDGSFNGQAGDLLDAMKTFHATMALCINWPNLPDASHVLSKFDAGLQFYGVEERIVHNNALKVDHLAWSKNPDIRPRLVTVRADGGVRALVPKIAITGPDNAGKTTFVRNLSAAAVSAERMHTTVALDKGHYENDGVEAELFGTPGEQRFDPLINTLIEQAAAVILIVDAADKTSFQRAQDLLQRVQRRGLRVVVVANKQDLDDAMTAAELEDHLAFPTVPCTAVDVASARAVMDDILQDILTEVTT